MRIFPSFLSTSSTLAWKNDVHDDGVEIFLQENLTLILFNPLIFEKGGGGGAPLSVPLLIQIYKICKPAPVYSYQLKISQ